MAVDASEKSDWNAVIARALSFLCVNGTDLKDKTLAQKATFLASLGLKNADIASLLGSTPASIGELIRQNRAKKVKNGKKPKAGKKV